nr:M56 family metallopeptidase [uncultured Acetatifactor sp.]
MNYLFLMTLGGSILLIGYLVWERLFEKSMTQHMGYAALVTVLLIYLVPWVWIKGIYRFVLFAFWDESVIGDAKGLVNIADLKTQESAYRTEDYRVLVIFAVIWFIGAFAIMIVKTFRYIHMRRGLYGLSIKCGDENLDETVERLRKELRCRRKPKVVWTRVNNKTFTLGAICPIIFLQKDYDDGELYWILKHEMTHIVRGDLLIKMLLEFASCLYWFNPFIYVLTHRLEFMSEASCDERVLKGCDEKEREMYIELLDKNKDGNRVEIPFCSALEDGDRDIDKRIKLLKEMRTIKGKKKLFAVCVFVFLVVANSLIAFAYPKVRHVELVVKEAAEEAVDGNNFWSYNYVEEGYEALADVVVYDEQFVDEAGQVYPIRTPDTSFPCDNHDIVSGYYQMHVVNEDGSCVVETYECTKCVRCDTIWLGDFCTKSIQFVCEH